MSRPQSCQTKIEQVAMLKFCLHAVARFRFHQGNSKS